jgi:hypothetical protein
MRMVVSSWFVVAALTCPNVAAAQRRVPGAAAQEQTVPATIALKVGAASYSFTGQASCEHAARGSIYDTVAERWSVRHNDNGRNLNLNLWHPTAGTADMVTLSMSAGGKRYDVDTVKKPQSPKTSGSGMVRMAPEGGGGTFTVDLTTESGDKITGTIKC